ncbi:hypothetical protein MGL_1506 [Malassezia globosa CBS 7966]|uniref:DNA ligase 1 n=1 Tax=Malassezia globosa (strain ATCC MYA-4612 / CBS 7966) TaxID=425265 RepID=A8PXR2_MALGO|nr:uncharacterized protein MGL_1506 [Malassezia globosa CBS 7966]EDP44109.1 hypothetical protein MGL_1506 [Malassezia globosa CBS 7966]
MPPKKQATLESLFSKEQPVPKRARVERDVHEGEHVHPPSTESAEAETTLNTKVEEDTASESRDGTDSNAISSSDKAVHMGHVESSVKTESATRTPMDAMQGRTSTGQRDATCPTDTAGAPIPYATLVDTFSKVEATSKRLEILELVTQLFLQVIYSSRGGDDKPLKAASENLLYTVYLCINRLCPDYEGLELGIGEGLLVKAIAQSTGREIVRIKRDFERLGDLGLVAHTSKKNQPTMFRAQALTVRSVFQQLKQIAAASGAKSQDKKLGIIKRLLATCSGEESKYLIRSLEGKLRIGLAEKTVLVAVAQAVMLATHDGKPHEPKQARDAGDANDAAKLTERLEQGTHTVKAVFSEVPSYDLLIPALLEHGVEHVQEHLKLSPGIPLKPMLAKPTKAIGEVLDRFEAHAFTCEYKYDGERAQVHGFRGSDGQLQVRVFSRNSEDMSVKYPDLVVQIPHCLRGGGENVQSFVLDAEAVAWQPRDEASHTEGRLLPFQELSRRKRKDVQATDMLCGSDATYEPSRRSINWLKLKKDYLSGTGDSLDLTVIGAYYGRGKRTNVYGAFLLACYDEDSETYQSICKIGTGFSEADLDAHYSTLKELEIPRKKGYYDLGEAKPDVFFEPRIVWEVLAADLSLSPVYTAARGAIDARGISLRFPRFIRIRDDKSPDMSTTPEQVASMYRAQAMATQSARGKDDEDEFW